MTARTVHPPFTHKIAFPPARRPDAVSPQWLDWLVELGYTGIYLETDPFTPPRSGNVSQFPIHYRLFSLYDLAWGEHRHRLREWIQQACELAHARGLKVYLSLHEPRIPAEAWGLFPVEWHGRGGWDREPWNLISWCMSHPDAARAFEQMATDAFAAVPGMDGLMMVTYDNDAHHCSDACPRCKGMSAEEKIARVFASLIRAADAGKLHRDGFDYALCTWWWTPGSIAAVTDLMKGRRVTVLGRSTQNLMQHWRGRELGRVFDLSLGQRGIGDTFRKEAADCHERGWAITDLTPFGHAYEYFWLPYTPAPNRVAERIVGLRESGAAGWFDFDCGGIHPGINVEVIRQDHLAPGTDARDLVDRTLAALYPTEEIAQARAAYELAEEALAARPIGFNPPDVRNLSGRCMLELVIALPFDPTDITLLDQGHRTFWFAPSNCLTPQSIPTLLEMYETSSAGWQQAWETFAPLRGAGAWEQNVFRAHALASGSAFRYIRMAALRLARSRGELTATQERDALVPLLTDELAAAEEFAELWRADRRLLDNVCWRLHEWLQSCVPWVTIDRDDPFVTKLAHTRAMIERLKTVGALDFAPRWKD